MAELDAVIVRADGQPWADKLEAVRDAIGPLSEFSVYSGAARGQRAHIITANDDPIHLRELRRLSEVLGTSEIEVSLGNDDEPSLTVKAWSDDFADYETEATNG